MKTKQSKKAKAERCRAMLQSKRGYPADDSSGDIILTVAFRGFPLENYEYAVTSIFILELWGVK